MRCLFLPDELEAFRPVATAIRDIGAEFVMLREFNAARRILDGISFDLVIVGASSIDTPTTRFLREWRPSFIPALGVTCVSWMVPELLTAGADCALLLPDQAADLVAVVRRMGRQSAY